MSSNFRVVLAWAAPIVSALAIGVSAVSKIANEVDSAKAEAARIRGLDATKHEMPRSSRHNGEK